ncbi:MAG: glycosyltransferase family 2 protein [Bacilli bacterium]
MKTISLVIPCYNEEQNINIFHKTVKEVLDKLPLKHKLIFVDDGSTDNTLLKIKKLATDETVTYISFARNFGKEAAIYAGLKKVDSDYAVIIDVDLQHNPNKMLIMYDLIAKENYDFIITKRIDRYGESKIKSFFANLFYKLMNKWSDITIENGIQDYCMMKRQVVDAILSVPEYHRFSKGIYNWIGFNKKIIEVKNESRKYGRSTWSFRKLVKYAIDGLTSFSILPLGFATIAGLLTAVMSIVYLAFVLIKTLVFGEVVKGFPTIVILMLFLGSIQLIALGIIGEYISKIYLEAKRRPIYIVKEEKHD